VTDDDVLPQSGDVVIVRRAASAAAYVLRVFRGAFQVSFSTFDEALARAESFARHDRVDVWYTEDERSFRLVTGRRVAERA
jgi:hypothetical protein